MKNIVIEKEDFNFLKKSNSTNHTKYTDSRTINSKTITRKVSLCCFFVLLTVFSTQRFHINSKDMTASPTTSQMTLQDLHNIKEQSANFVTQLSFSDKNVNNVMYGLETNPIMNLNAQNSLKDFFIKKKQNNKKIEFATIKDSPPLYSESSVIAGHKYDTITVPVIETFTDITTRNTENSYSLINFTYETINGKYILKSIE